MKQTIEIEVPEGKQAIIENNQIKYIDSEHWKSIKTFDDALDYCCDHSSLSHFEDAYEVTHTDYEEKVAKLRLIVAALTNNEKLSLIKGNLYFPIIQFCNKENISKCLGNKIIGKIKIEGKEYLVVGWQCTLRLSYGYWFCLL